MKGGRSLIASRRGANSATSGGLGGGGGSSSAAAGSAHAIAPTSKAGRIRRQRAGFFGVSRSLSVIVPPLSPETPVNAGPFLQPGEPREIIGVVECAADGAGAIGRCRDIVMDGVSPAPGRTRVSGSVAEGPARGTDYP